MKQNSQGKPIAITVAMACTELSIKKTSLYVLIARGDLTKIKVLGRTLIVYKSLEAFVDRATQNNCEG